MLITTRDESEWAGGEGSWLGHVMPVVSLSLFLLFFNLNCLSVSLSYSPFNRACVSSVCVVVQWLHSQRKYLYRVWAEVKAWVKSQHSSLLKTPPEVIGRDMVQTPHRRPLGVRYLTSPAETPAAPQSLAFKDEHTDVALAFFFKQT